MAKNYKKHCKDCGKYYEGQGRFFCSRSCSCRNHTKGRKITWKDKISSTLRGRKLSKQHVANIKRALKGRRLSQLHKVKLSETGRERWKDNNFRVSHLKKQCIKCGCFMSSSGGHRCRSSAWNKGLRDWAKGTRAGFQKGHKINLGKKVGKLLTKEQYRKNGLAGLVKQQNSKEPTSIEVKVYKELQKRGLLFETQKLINGKFLVDAYIPSLNLIIEADGDYWHSLERVKKKDKAENAYLKKCGFNLLRLSGTEIKNNEFKDKIERMVN